MAFGEAWDGLGAWGCEGEGSWFVGSGLTDFGSWDFDDGVGIWRLDTNTMVEQG